MLDLKALLRQPRSFSASQSLSGRRLDLLAAERELQRFLQGKQPASDVAAAKLAEIMVSDRLDHETVGLAYLADRDGFEFACRGLLGRLKYRLQRMLTIGG